MLNLAAAALWAVTTFDELFQAFSKADPEPRAISVRLSFDLASNAAMRAVAVASVAAYEPSRTVPTREPTLVSTMTPTTRVTRIAAVAAASGG